MCVCVFFSSSSSRFHLAIKRRAPSARKAHTHAHNKSSANTKRSSSRAKRSSEPMRFACSMGWPVSQSPVCSTLLTVQSNFAYFYARARSRTFTFIIIIISIIKRARLISTTVDETRRDEKRSSAKRIETNVNARQRRQQLSYYHYYSKLIKLA